MIPDAPAAKRLRIFNPAPRGNAKKGIVIDAPGAQNLRISSSMFPRMIPTITGTRHPISIDIGMFATPAAPRASMVKNGPSLMESIDTAPTSEASPYSPASEA